MQPAELAWPGVSPLFEATITEDLPALLYRTCGGSVAQIKELVLNKEAYDYCRSSALGALNFAVVGGIVSREEMLDFYGSFPTQYKFVYLAVEDTENYQVVETAVKYETVCQSIFQVLQYLYNILYNKRCKKWVWK